MNPEEILDNFFKEAREHALNLEKQEQRRKEEMFRLKPHLLAIRERKQIQDKERQENSKRNSLLTLNKPPFFYFHKRGKQAFSINFLSQPLSKK